MRHIVSIALIMVSISGCRASSTYSNTMLPDGSSGAVVMCHDRPQCFSLSSRACPTGYQVIEAEDNHPHVVDANGENSYLVPTDNFNPSSRGTEFVIRCTRPSDGF